MTDRTAGRKRGKNTNGVGGKEIQISNQVRVVSCFCVWICGSEEATYLPSKGRDEDWGGHASVSMGRQFPNIRESAEGRVVGPSRN